jgi:hypothetical protein
MPRQITATDGTAWTVTLSGRSTQYAKDEVSLAFTASGETRYARRQGTGARVRGGVGRDVAPAPPAGAAVVDVARR